ncbi:FliI/YscN family ATPase [Vibrio coralliirubri]|uniref:FliI/YscN family ATPase n=1 Tax=Vibrio coralliirubri TaxID=1516159 RepID=UPI002284B7D0|nr:FliI/YscN family ATPase [Vibrio coralliirubri]MCY9860995.1 FliI/YscN family ATPase [Vibrio coralliirubri]
MNITNKIKTKSFDRLGFNRVGRVLNVLGTTIEAEGFEVPLNGRCILHTDGDPIYADVVGFNNNVTLLQPLGSVSGIKPNTKVTLFSDNPSLPFSDDFLGCVIDPLGEVLIGEPVKATMAMKTNNTPLNINQRGSIDQRFNTGVCAIDSLFPIGFGQRIGLFAGTGVGKSMLLGMITRFSAADVVVVGLIGERGREVYEFVHHTLSEDARAKCVIVAAPADYPPILRMQGADVATAIAEHYRDKGLNVLLLVDSVTRYAQAQREVALASGEAPATKGYPASVFAKLPFLIERAGKAKSGGSITAIYTVLTEGDDMNDPVADAARGVLDGHIILSRKIASKGVYPAIDVPNSLSRLAQELSDDVTYSSILKVKELFSIIDENEELYSLGLIEKGANPSVDKAMSMKKDLLNIVVQDFNKKSESTSSAKVLANLTRKIN